MRQSNCHGIRVYIETDDLERSTIHLLSFFMRDPNLVKKSQEVSLFGRQELVIRLIESGVVSELPRKSIIDISKEVVDVVNCDCDPKNKGEKVTQRRPAPQLPKLLLLSM